VVIGSARPPIESTTSPASREAIPEPTDSVSRVSGAIIRIHPERIISFALDTPDLEPHEVQVHSRAVPAT
jgi:pyridoxamine 5'-phosphate oxidase family protein